MRYKRYKKRYGGTRSIKMKFQSFMDIATSDTSMQIITVSAGGKNILNRCPAQFSAYKYYRIGSVSVKLVPASTLPVDPSGLSYSANDPGVDPRDQLTPGLMRITNGEDILEDISGLTDTEQHGIYNSMLLDPRWFKWMLQSGVKRYATPRYWTIGQLHQDKWPGAIINVPTSDYNVSGRPDGTTNVNFADVKNNPNGNGVLDGITDHNGSSPYGMFQTGHMGRLGWLPTDGLQHLPFADTGADPFPFIASPPEVEVMKIILPKAYKTKYYYRMFVTETVYFKEPIVTYPMYGNYRPLDIFHVTASPTPTMPYTMTSNIYPTDSQTGGNYGDN